MMTTRAWDKLGVWVMKPGVMLVFFVFQALLIRFVDKPLAIMLHAAYDAQCYPWLNQLTDLGQSQWYLGGLLILACVYRYGIKHKHHEQRIWFLWFLMVLSNSICLVLKVCLGRARPELWFSEHRYGFYGLQFHADYWSFPSGHATTIMALVCGLALLFPRYLVLYACVGFMVVLSRVLLLQHYLSDVFMSTALVLLELSMLRWFMRKSQKVNGAWLN